MLIPVIVFAISLLALIWSADRFVAGAAALAAHLGISTAMIGLTVIALGTSAPEILVSATAAWQGSTALALGNAQGSNIANIGLVMGVVLTLAALPVSLTLLRSQSLILLLATVLLGFMLQDLYLGRVEGLVLLAGLVAFLGWTIYQSQHDRALASQAAREAAAEMQHGLPRPQAIGLTLVGLLLLLIASRGLVWSATDIARSLGISELVIGATIVAIGTSLPELASAVSSTLKKHHDMTLGNLLGSNVFNIFAVVGVAGMITPAQFEAAIWTRDFAFVALTAFVMLALIQWYGHRRQRIPRPYGWILIGLYAFYLWLNFQAMYA